jgi:hypothetical protein
MSDSHASNELRLVAGHAPAELRLRPEETNERRPEYFQISVSLGGGEASGRLRFYDFRFSWLPFFKDVAADWKGWRGEKRWESLEGDVSLVATHDGGGHVDLIVELRPQTAPGHRGIEQIWKLEGVLQLEAGQLDQLVRDVARFEEQLSPSAK